jgi:hypothetical protein
MLPWKIVSGLLNRSGKHGRSIYNSGRSSLGGTNRQQRKYMKKQNIVRDWLQPKQYRGNGRFRKQKQTAPCMVKPRLPTETEKQELLDFLIENGELTEEQRDNAESMTFSDSVVAVFDHYQMYAGKYQGKLMVITSDFDPRNTEIWLWVDGKIGRASAVLKGKGLRIRIVPQTTPPAPRTETLKEGIPS